MYFIRFFFRKACTYLSFVQSYTFTLFLPVKYPMICNSYCTYRNNCFRIKTQNRCHLRSLDPLRREKSRKTVMQQQLVQCQLILFSRPLRIPLPLCKLIQGCLLMLILTQTQLTVLVQSGTHNLKLMTREADFLVPLPSVHDSVL